MELRDIVEYLEARLVDRTITLAADSSPIGVFFVPMLLRTKHPSLTLVDCTLEKRSEDHPVQVVLRGNAVLFPDAAGTPLPRIKQSMPVTLRLELREERLDYRLEATASGSYTLDAFFGALPEQYIVRAGCIRREKSALAELRLQNPTLLLCPDNPEDYPFSLRGTLLIGGAQWQQYFYLLGASLPVQGKLSSRHTVDGFPYFELTGELSSTVSPLPAQPLSSDKAASWMEKAALRLYLQSGAPSQMYEAQSVVTSVGLGVSFRFRGMETDAELLLPLFSNDEYWRMQAKFSPGLSLGDVINFFSGLFQIEGGRSALLLPTEAQFNKVKLAYLALDMEKSQAGLRLDRVAAMLRIDSPWVLPLPFLTLDKLCLLWQIQWDPPKGDGPRGHLLAGEIAATATVDLFAGKKLRLSAKATIPDLALEASLALEETPEEAVTEEAVTEEAVTEEEPLCLQDLIGSGPAQALPGEAEGPLTLAQVTLNGEYYGRRLALSAQVRNVLSFKLGSVSVKLEELHASAEFSQAGNSFGLGGVIAFGEAQNALEPFDLSLEGGYQAGDWTFHGWLSRGEISLTGLITAFLAPGDQAIALPLPEVSIRELDVSYAYHSREKTSNFSLATALHADWGTVLGQPVSSDGAIRLASDKQGLNYISLMLSLTLSEMQIAVQADNFHTETPTYHFLLGYRDKVLRASYLIKQVEGAAHTVLCVSMERITLGDLVSWAVERINPNARFSLPAPWDFLGQIDLSKINLEIDLTGKLVTFRYAVHLNLLNLLTIDAVGMEYRYGGNGGLNLVVDSGETRHQWDPMREAPPSVTKSPTKFHLSYLGLGQHYGSEAVRKAGTIATAIQALRDTFRPGKPGGAALYDAQSNWLFGADFTINEALRARLVLNDPALYGILITVESNQAPFAQFKGLSLELLYKKVTREIGMFKVTLQLPERMRVLNLGAIRVTIGQMSAEIYTNGDFLLDLGFPHNRDFSRSFGFQYGIFSGRGGIYFGLLSGATCPSLPKPATGAFASVLSIGIGLAIGINRSFDFGIVSGGLSLEVIGIFEGLFAVYEPEGGGERTTFYRVHAVAGLAGRVFLKVNLFIISLEASAAISAFASLSLEAYRETQVELDVSISLSAKLKVLFFTIEVSFSFSQHFQFTLGERTRAPWDALAADVAAVTDIFEVVALSEEKTHLPFCVSPLFSLAGESYCAGFVPVMGQEAAGELVRLLSEWMLHRFSECPGAELPDSLTDAQCDPLEEVDYARLSEFLRQNTRFDLMTTHDESEGYALPMPPPVRLTFSADGKEQPLLRVEYWKDNPVPDSYADDLRKYFALFSTIPDEPLPVRNDAGERPLSETVFLDYFHMLLRALMRSASALYRQCEITTDRFDCGGAARAFSLPLAQILMENLDLQLAQQTLRVPQRTVRAGQRESLTQLGARLDATGRALLSDNLNACSLLRQGAALAIEERSFLNPTGLAPEQAAAMFFVRYGKFQTEPYHLKYVPTLGACVPREMAERAMEWESLGESFTIALPVNPDGYAWVCLPGDTVERLAQLCAIWNGELQGFAPWEDYLADFLSRNQGWKGGPLQIPQDDVEIAGDGTLAALGRRLFAENWSGENNAWGSLLSQPLLRQNAELRVLNTAYELPGGLTVRQALEKWGLTIQELAPSLEGAAGWAGGQALSIREAVTIPKALIQALLCSDKNVMQLAGAASRFLLQGLRIPKPGEQGTATCGFYEVLRQQAPLAPEETQWTLTLEPEPGTAWMAGTQQLSFCRDEVTALLPEPTFDWTAYYTLAQPPELPPFLFTQRAYTLGESILWLRCGEGGGAAPVLALHPFPPELRRDYARMAHPTLRDRNGVLPWEYAGILVELDIALVGGMISVRGAGPEERLLLEQAVLVAGEGPAPEYCLLTRPPVADGMPSELVELAKTGCSLLLRTNLSRETRMFPEGAVRSAALPCAVPYGSPECLRLLWECSTVGGDGYYLQIDGELPQPSFDAEGAAKLWLFIRGDERMAECVNCAVSAQTAAAAQGTPFFLADGGDGTLEQQAHGALPPGAYAVRLTAPREGQDGAQSVFSILGYRVAGDFYSENKDRDSRPLLPVDQNGRRVYDIVAPLHRMTKDPDGSPYQVLKKPAQLQIYCRDVLGNQAEKTLSYTLVPGVSDVMLGIHEWPGLTLSYELLEEEGPRLVLHLGWGEETVEPGLLEQMRLSLWQLDTALELRLECTLLDDILFTDALMRALREFGWGRYHALTEGMPTPAPIRLSLAASVRRETPAHFPLEVRLVVRREGDDALPPAALRAVSDVEAKLDATQPQSLQAFAAMLEGGFPSFKLARRGERGKELHLVRVGEGGLVPALHIAPYADPYHSGDQAPIFYALRPVSNRPVSRTIPAESYGRDGGGTPVRYVNVDVDGWVLRFFADLESLLEPEFLPSLSRFAPEAVNALMAAKEALAGRGAELLEPLSPGVLGGALDAAREAVRNRLRKSLTQGMRLSAVAEYDARYQPGEVRLVPTITPLAGHDPNLAVHPAKLDLRRPGLLLLLENRIAYQSACTLAVALSISDVEYDIHTSDNGYESSKWLRLVLPITPDSNPELLSADLSSDLLAPNPLRSLPGPVRLEGQACLPEQAIESSAAKVLPQLCRWRHQIDSVGRAIEQDEYLFTVAYRDGQEAHADESSRDLFTVLGGYDQLRDRLLADIRERHSPEAFTRFAALAQELADVWPTGLALRQAPRSWEDTLECTVQYRADLRRMELMSSTKGWPVTLTSDTAGEEGEPGQELGFRLLASALPIYTRNTTNTSAVTVRNASLLRRAASATGKGPEISPAFIYRTDEAALPPLYASISHEEAVCVGVIHDNLHKRSVLLALDLLLDALELGGHSNPVSLSVSYQYRLGGERGQTDILLPILLAPGVPLGTRTANVGLVNSIVAWYEKKLPVQLNFALCFGLTVYGTKGESPRALMELGCLRVDFRRPDHDQKPTQVQ